MSDIPNSIIRARRIELGLTLEQVGDYVGVSKSTVQKWESGYIANMRRDKIAKLAEVLHISPMELMGGDALDSIPAGFEAMPDMHYIPILGTIACGKPILAEEQAGEFYPCPDTVRADFCLRCRGDSMIGARILDGDIVYIRKQPEVENAQIAAVLIGDEATLKRVYKIGTDTLELRAENPTYPVLTFKREQLNDITILGLAVAFTSGIK